MWSEKLSNKHNFPIFVNISFDVCVCSVIIFLSMCSNVLFGCGLIFFFFKVKKKFFSMILICSFSLCVFFKNILVQTSKSSDKQNVVASFICLQGNVGDFVFGGGWWWRLCIFFFLSTFLVDSRHCLLSPVFPCPFLLLLLLSVCICACRYKWLCKFLSFRSEDKILMLRQQFDDDDEKKNGKSIWCNGFSRNCRDGRIISPIIIIVSIKPFFVFERRFTARFMEWHTQKRKKKN